MNTGEFNELYSFLQVTPNGAGCFIHGSNVSDLAGEGALAAAFRTQLAKVHDGKDGLERAELICVEFKRMLSTTKKAMHKLSSPYFNSRLAAIEADHTRISDMVRILVLGYVNRDVGIMGFSKDDTSYEDLRGQQRLYGLAAGCLHMVVLVLAVAWELGRFIPTALDEIHTSAVPGKVEVGNAAGSFKRAADAVETFLLGDSDCITALEIVWRQCSEIM